MSYNKPGIRDGMIYKEIDLRFPYGELLAKIIKIERAKNFLVSNLSGRTRASGPGSKHEITSTVKQGFLVSPEHVADFHKFFSKGMEYENYIFSAFNPCH